LQTIRETLVVGEMRTNTKHRKSVVNSVNKSLTAIPALIHKENIFPWKLY
jgi:hypothetical protein